MKIPVLIPAYQPDSRLVDIVDELLAKGATQIIVVNDGSSAEHEAFFSAISARPGVQLLRHAVNLGKGAALKTGMNYVLWRFPDALGVVTADADGQHDPTDIVRIGAKLAERPGHLVLGVRTFRGDIPLRSRFGNLLTQALVRFLIGQALADTQTGLRGVPTGLIPPLLRISSSGYEFELDMLIACKHEGRSIVQEPISTIYLDGNRSSHFNPVLDSMRIYAVLLRFSMLALLTALLDNVVFALMYNATDSVLRSQMVSRLVAVCFNYTGASSVVFQSKQRHQLVLPKYLLLVAIHGLLSYGLIRLILSNFDVAVVVAKLIAEGLLFIASFAVQRDFVFTKRKLNTPSAEWDS